MLVIINGKAVDHDFGAEKHWDIVFGEAIRLANIYYYNRRGLERMLRLYRPSDRMVIQMTVEDFWEHDEMPILNE